MSNDGNLSHRRSYRLPIRGRIYLSAPLPLYRSQRYTSGLARLGALCPGVVILEALEEYRSTLDWSERMPATLSRASALVFLTTREGWIGRGVWDEIDAARKRGMPVYHLSDEGRLIPADALAFTDPDPSNWTHHVQVTVPEAT